MCATCNLPLVVEVETEQGDEHEVMAGSSTPADQLVDDDVTLPCRCHFHWLVNLHGAVRLKMADTIWVTRQCLLDAYISTECPNCKRKVSSDSSAGKEQILCSLKNEGGVQGSFDILPILKEESYLRAFPEERKCRAFLEFCSSGDAQAVIEMLEEGEDEDQADTSEPASAVLSQSQMLRYQDQLGSLNSGLHLAIANDKPEIVWLLLWLASNLNPSRFPPNISALAQEAGIVRQDLFESPDIRLLKNADGMTAGDLARHRGGTWNEWIENQILE